MYHHGGDIYKKEVKVDFSANINPMGMPASVRKAVEESIANCVNYPDPFCRELTKAIAIKEDIKPKYILCGNGAADLIFRFVFAKRPKKALLLAPSFSEYRQALLAIDCEIEYHTLSVKDEFYLTEAFLDNITEEIDVVILSNPNNPTGILIKKQLLEKILKKCHETNTFLLLDECFLDFVVDGQQLSMKCHIKKNSHLIILKAFTKMYAVAGLRLGYCICSDVELIEKMCTVSQSWAVSVPAQAAGLAALQEDTFVEQTVEMIQKERQFLISELENMGIICYDSCANYVFFKSEKGLYTKLLEKGLLIRSCHNYIGLYRGYYRIAVKEHSQNEILLKAIKEVK